MTDIITYDKEGNPSSRWANDLVKDEQVNFEGWMCGIGLESIEIRQDGSMFRGTCKVGGKIGHVDDKVWNLPKSFISCYKDRCTCVADIKSTRYKSTRAKIDLKQKVKAQVQELGGDAAESYI